jgi:hypothetical protein
MIVNRPKYFNSLENVLDYFLSYKIVGNKDSLIKSIPSLFKQEGNKFYWKTNLIMTCDYW